MIRVGPPLRLRQLDDRWGRQISLWEAPSSGFVDEDKWARIAEFQAPYQPIPNEDLPSPYLSMEALLAHPYGKMVNAKLMLNPSRSTIWEMDLYVTPKSDNWDRIRMVTSLGDPELKRWTWVDTYIRRPALHVAARFLNWWNKSLRARDYEEYNR